MNDYVVAMYGSAARGEDDGLSDHDVLVVGDLDRELPFTPRPELSVSQYSWTELQRMASYGSLFLVHLKLEARVMSGTPVGRVRYQSLTTNLKDYQYVERDLRAFNQSIEDAKDAIATGDTSKEFELASLATVVRHASILGCYLVGAPTFGRLSAVHTFSLLRDLDPRIRREFALAYSYRMAVARDLSMPPTPTPAFMSDWVGLAFAVVEEVGRCSGRTLPSAD